MAFGSGIDGVALASAFNRRSGVEDALDPVASEAEAALSPDAGAFKVGSLTSQFLSRAVVMGNLETGQVSVALSGTAAATAERDRAEKEKEDKRNFEDRLHQMLMDRIRFHEDRMEDTASRLRLVYGDDIVGGMAAKYLTPEQIANARSEEELMLELKNVMLDSEGHIRPEYAGTDDALYVYDWNQSRSLRSDLDRLPTASPAEAQQIYQGIREEDNVTLNSARRELQQDEVATQVAEDRLDSTGQASVAALPTASANSLGV